MKNFVQEYFKCLIRQFKIDQNGIYLSNYLLDKLILSQTDIVIIQSFKYQLAINRSKSSSVRF